MMKLNISFMNDYKNTQMVKYRSIDRYEFEECFNNGCSSSASGSS